MKRTISVAAAAALALGLSACNGAQDTSTATSAVPSAGAGSSTTAPGSPEPGTPGTSSAESTGAAGPSTTAAGAELKPVERQDGTVERLTNDGGVVTKGSSVTFVYNNGLRYTFDAGKDVPKDTTVTMTTPQGRLEIRADGSASWLPTGRSGVATVSAQGAGTMVDKDGLVTVTDTGTTACASGKGLNLVNADGSKAQATPAGVIVLDKDGKTTRYDRPGTSDPVAGRFNQCGPGNTVQVDLTADVLFEFDKSDLTPSGKQVVASAAKIINENGKGKTVRVVGHTDAMGTPERNVTLGQERADSVKTELAGLCPGQAFSTESKGQTEPVAANVKPDGSDNPEGRAKNRRVVITWAR